MLYPKKAVPNLSLPTLDHGSFDLANYAGERGSIICFYRGYHCPACATYLMQLQDLQSEFESRGVKVIAVSSDGQERARLMGDKIKADTLPIAYDLPLEKAREWGLYISQSRGKTSINIEEPALFSEPGLFMVTPQNTLYYGFVQTMPFSRPNWQELLGALDFVIKNDYPARGAYTGAL